MRNDIKEGYRESKLSFLDASDASYEFLMKLADRRVYLSGQGGKLKYRAPEGAIDETLRLMLRQFKDGLLKTLQKWSGYQILSPLSYNQQSLFFLYLFEPTSTAYNLALSMRLQSAVDAAKMKNALERLVQRHEQLRTTFGHIKLGEILAPVQFIHEESSPSFEVIDAHDWTETELTENLQNFSQKPFDLEKGSVIRAGLFVQNQNDARFVLAFHHIVSDGWSTNLIWRDLAAAYCGELSNNEIARGAEYTDFTLAQRRKMETESGREHLDYWVKIHKSPAPSFDLGNNARRPSIRRSVGATHYFHIDRALRETVERMAQKQGITTFALTLSVFEWLLFERLGRRDVVVGIPVVGHNERKFENTVGYFVNPIPLRSQRSGAPSFLEHAQATAQELRMALDHREAPFAAIVERLGGTRDITHTPIFQVMFHLLSRKMLGDVVNLLYPFESSPPVDFGGLIATACPLDLQNGQFDLTLELIDNGREILGLLKYCTDLFTAADAQALASAFCAKLKVALENPETALFSSGKDKAMRNGAMQKSMNFMVDRQISATASIPPNQQHKQDIASNPDHFFSEASTLSAKERHNVDSNIIKWNKTERAYPLNKCLQSFIEEQVIKTPDAPALCFEDKTLSYKDLNKRVNQLTHFLCSKGVGPEILVGVCAFRSIEMVIALLAIVKAGGAYVPFDPTYPVKRLSFIVNDSKATVILAQKACASLIDKKASQNIYFEDIGEQLETYPATNPPIKTNPDNLAYVIYTSGSTGNPKGTMNTHKGIVNRLLWMQETFQIDASDTLLQKTPFSFDVSVWEFFWPLMCGARLVVAKPEGHKDLDYLLDLINREKVTVIHFVPSMLRLFLDKADQLHCASLRHVVVSGEALSIDLQKRYFSILKTPLHNLYGPTEAAVDVSYWKCDPLAQSNIVPIGRPISNTKLYVLDENLQSVPIGESGELYIGGVQVGRGYLNRPGLTAEKFIKDPFSDDQAARLYKTGDLCRFLPDGNIEYLGRIDFQVKIRGNRVELGEIEAAILTDSSVKDCVVIGREDTPGEQRLVAYVIENEGRFSLSSMRQKLAAELPDYMIPSVFVRMPFFPLSPSGKTDRLALPIPSSERPELVNRYIAPQGETERLIVKIWLDLLPVDKVGLDDNFFDLGGNSLLLVRVANKLNNMFHKDISVISLFEHPTVREQVDFICGIKNQEIAISVGTATAQHATVNDGEWEDGAI